MCGTEDMPFCLQSLPPSATQGRKITTEEEEQVKSFMDMCVDDDGSAICSAVYNEGNLQLTVNSRFAAMYMTLEELESTIARDRSRPEILWRRWVSHSFTLETKRRDESHPRFLTVLTDEMSYIMCVHASCCSGFSAQNVLQPMMKLSVKHISKVKILGERLVKSWR